MGKRMSKKTLLTIVSVALVAVLVIGATLAYLSDITGWSTNTFEFDENGLRVILHDVEQTYKIIPGKTQEKDPSVEVQADLDCYVYLGIKAENTEINGKTIVEWSADSGWTPLDYQDDSEEFAGCELYYREVPTDAANKTFDILSGNRVRYPLNITAADVPAGTEIKLKFRAKAVQKEGFLDAKSAFKGEAAPTATLRNLDVAEIGELTDGSGWTGPLSAAIQFNADDTPDSLIARDPQYADWNVDFVLSFDQNIGNGADVHLFGNYGAYGWIGDNLANFGLSSIAADQEIPIMTSMLGTNDITYADVVNIVSEFKCGIAVENAPADLTATLKLIMTSPEGEVFTLSESQVSIA